MRLGGALTAHAHFINGVEEYEVTQCDIKPAQQEKIISANRLIQEELESLGCSEASSIRNPDTLLKFNMQCGE